MTNKEDDNEAIEKCDVFGAFARGVASVLGKGCWDILRHDVIRRTTNLAISKSVVLHETGVSMKLRSGAIEFHRLIYVLATYGKTLADLPDRFPARSALRLSGIRFLAFHNMKQDTSKSSRISFENIVTEFPLWEFFIAIEIAKEIAHWRLLSVRSAVAKTTSNSSDTLSSEISQKTMELEVAATRSMQEYNKSLVAAFGPRFEDKEMRKDLEPLKRTDVWDLLPSAQRIIDANRLLLAWLDRNVIKDHSVWQATE